MIRLGYLVPEFPGQTHIFFWRELAALAAMDVQCDLVSTREPPDEIVSHSWSQEAMGRTTYLSPMSARDICAALWELLRNGPASWWRSARGILGAPEQNIRMIGLAVAGARLAAIARKKSWQHLHVHSAADSANVAMFAHLISGLPYSLTLHGPLEDYGPNQPSKWRNAAFGIVITRRLLEQVRASLNTAAPKTILIAPMGVNVQQFKRSGLYQPWIGNGPLRIFSCGRLNPCKGHDDLIRAVGLLRQTGIDARVTIAGADDSLGKYQPVLEKLIDELKLRDAVTLLGAVSEQAVREGLEQSHIFSLASLHEPLGVAIMEAMSMELPVVVTGAGGVPELVDDEIDGILVEPRNPGQLSEAIERVARNPARAGRLAETARKKVERSFQSDQSARVLVRQLQTPQ